jgi:hypothetical protein
LRLLDLSDGQVSVNDVDGHIESFWKQSELSVNVNDPFDKESSGGILYLCLLFLKVLVIDLILGFKIKHGLINLMSEFRN